MTTRTIDRIDIEPVHDDAPDAVEMLNLMLDLLEDGLDHPEIWSAIPEMLDALPDMPERIEDMLAAERDDRRRTRMLVLLGICGGALGQAESMLLSLAPLAAAHSQSPLVQGAIFHLRGVAAPDDKRYDLSDKFCATPFEQIDVLERSSHLCCASWLQTSAGDMSTGSWDAVWNSEAAQSIRESIHDNSFRHCNKTACPQIMGGDLPTVTAVRARSTRWSEIIDNEVTALTEGPERVNLAYDRTCNLSCPSCRPERFAADRAEREAFDAMQERAILPMLGEARLVFITGSGDPFASKNFRNLMERLTPEDYPDLRFQMMTNGMLFTRREWENFPALHGRVALMKLSIDAATGPTHELLRRGARWPVFIENAKFAAQLSREGLIDAVEFVFVVQRENYREMGDAVDLAAEVGVDSIYFARLTNWGTFDHTTYESKAVFLPGHPEFEDFRTVMRDPRLLRPNVILGDLAVFADGVAA